MTTRRGFLGAILAAGVAPAAVGSGILMPVKKIAFPEFDLDVSAWLGEYDLKPIKLIDFVVFVDPKGQVIFNGKRTERIVFHPIGIDHRLA